MRNVFLVVTVFLHIVPTAFSQIDVTSRPRHVFPQIADGRFADGSGYITSFSQRYEFRLADQSGNILDVRTVTMPSGGHLSKFVDELLNVPPGFFVGALSVFGAGGFNAIGLFHDGEVFSTMPVTVFY